MQFKRESARKDVIGLKLTLADSRVLATDEPKEPYMSDIGLIFARELREQYV